MVAWFQDGVAGVSLVSCTLCNTAAAEEASPSVQSTIHFTTSHGLGSMTSSLTSSGVFLIIASTPDQQQQLSCHLKYAKPLTAKAYLPALKTTTALHLCPPTRRYSQHPASAHPRWQCRHLSHTSRRPSLVSILWVGRLQLAPGHPKEQRTSLAWGLRQSRKTSTPAPLLCACPCPCPGLPLSREVSCRTSSLLSEQFLWWQ